MPGAPRSFGHMLMVAAAALTAAMLIAPAVRRVNAELTCNLGGAAPPAVGRLHVSPAPECEVGHLIAGSSRRAGS